MRHLCRSLTALLGAGLLAASAITASTQATLRLEELTVPEQRLPKGCQLGPVSRTATGETLVDPPPLGYRDNPWLGTNREHAASIRMRVDGLEGPTYGLFGPALWARLADDVSESYRARYQAPFGGIVDVYAVRFKDPKLTLAAATNPVIGQEAARIVRGATAVLVFRYPSEWTTVDHSGADCFRTIHDYIASLK